MESGSQAAPNFYTGDPLVISLTQAHWERRLTGDSIWLIEVREWQQSSPALRERENGLTWFSAMLCTAVLRTVVLPLPEVRPVALLPPPVVSTCMRMTNQSRIMAAHVAGSRATGKRSRSSSSPIASRSALSTVRRRRPSAQTASRSARTPRFGWSAAFAAPSRSTL